MGDVVSLVQRRAVRVGPGGGVRAGTRVTPVFSFDLASPWTYLAVERVDVLLPGVRWQPVTAGALRLTTAASGDGAVAADRAAAIARAAALRLPLVWPEDAGGRPRAARGAMRVAHYAAERGRAAAFVLAASRLAFCGGFDLDDPEILAEAVAAAGLPLDPCIAAMGDRESDDAMDLAARRLAAVGADRLPVVRVGRTLFCGEDRLSEAVAAARARRRDTSGRAPRLGVAHGLSGVRPR
jgi:2-hydroxychromene-2-carboxylate isomerase